jgi:hypothetical protein
MPATNVQVMNFSTDFSKKKALNTTCHEDFSNWTDLFHVYLQKHIKNLILTIRVLFAKTPKICCSFP